MLWLSIILTVITYIPICAGSVVIGIIIIFLSDGNSSNTPNPFVSPATVYTFYRKKFDGWGKGLSEWCKRESK